MGAGNQLVSFDERYTKARDWLLSAEMQSQMSLALPKHVDAGRLARLCLTEFKRTPKLLDCTSESLLGGVMEAAQLGLDIGTRGHAWLIPYKQTATLIIGYRGMLDLAWRSEKIASVYAHEVCDGDAFEYAFGSEQFIRHTPAPKSERGDITHAYAGCETTMGGKLMDVMTRDDIEEIRNRQRKQNSGPWVTDYPQMCCKTALRRMLKLAPCSTELQRAISIDEAADLGMPQGLDVAIDITPTGATDSPADPEQMKCEKCGMEIDPDGERTRYHAESGSTLYRCAECGPRKKDDTDDEATF